MHIGKKPNYRDSKRSMVPRSLGWGGKDEWIRKLWYIYTMEYYSAVKKNSFESVR